MQPNLIITVNPGTTTTRCAIYESLSDSVLCVAEEIIEHDDNDIGRFATISDQFDYRYQMFHDFAKRHIDRGDESRIIACAGRGGMLTPVPPGVIKINDKLVRFSLDTPVYNHASNLGAPLAHRLAVEFGVDAFIADPVSVDELPEVARLSGSPEFRRFSFVHALNIRSTVSLVAQELEMAVAELRLVVAHLGAGFSIAAVDRGRIIDNSNRMECSPFTPERTGGLPPISLIDACYSGKWEKAELLQKLYGQGGVYAYLGTRDMREVEKRIESGDQEASLVYDAMLYQINKAIGAMASTMEFNVDGIVLTGGLANSKKLTNRLNSKLERLAPVFIFAGSNENEALAKATLTALEEEGDYMDWPISIDTPSLANVQT
jgi:butyrate kinase